MRFLAIISWAPIICKNHSRFCKGCKAHNVPQAVGHRASKILAKGPKCSGTHVPGYHYHARANPCLESPSHSSELLHHQWSSDLTGLFVPTCLNTYNFFLLNSQPLKNKYVSVCRAKSLVQKLFLRALFRKKKKVSSSSLLSQDWRQLGTETWRRAPPLKNINLGFANTQWSPKATTSGEVSETWNSTTISISSLLTPSCLPSYIVRKGEE